MIVDSFVTLKGIEYMSPADDFKRHEISFDAPDGTTHTANVHLDGNRLFCHSFDLHADADERIVKVTLGFSMENVKIRGMANVVAELKEEAQDAVTAQ